METDSKMGVSPGAGTPESMAKPQPAHAPLVDLAGWKAISAQACMGVRSAYDASRRPVDPLPVYKRGRTPVASSAEVNAWLARQLRPMLPTSGAASMAPDAAA